MDARAGTIPIAVQGQRHYGLDWLRIAAFGLLIFYHITLVFVPGNWVIKSATTYEWLIVPATLLNPWRLALLFAVSGYASAKLLAKTGSVGAFAWSRAKRLLIPLAFGMVILVPVEMWVRVLQNGYDHGYTYFWLHDSWHWGRFFDTEFPSWEHLWFVEYLAAYTFALALVLAWLPQRADRVIAATAEWLSIRNRLLWAPAAALVTMKLGLLFVVPEKQGLFTDWSGHALYVPPFLFGFVLARTPALWAPMERLWRPALLASALAGAILIAIELTWQGDAWPPHAIQALDRAARYAMAWTMTLALFRLADRMWNRDHPLRATLSEAVFPFYLIHHGAIILTAWYLLPLGLHPLAEFVALVAATIAACLTFYIVGRDIAPLRPLIGLGPRRSKPAAVTPAAA
ncbi:acyltransferase family protein [Stakelama tenebrarum]|uniref:Acyltransferase family protein n=1 Tax=Stakelama tenebrarum TaxID=2711215 RepID=A0A6G6Y8V4_9SPHN|nr:acyltransferase family protein [Sphingosinithalassobacter tenebrarum]QIG81372.1 acyltransferase family protein [Sphingosinithalassobacter tenebrarum]